MTLNVCENVEKNFLNRFHDDFGKQFANAKARSRLDITPISDSEKHGAGYCYKGTINWRYDQTINDFIYLAHEAGHQSADMFGNGWPNHNITEWQGHFLQIALVDKLACSKQLEHLPFNTVAKIHRNHELLLDLADVQKGIKAINNLKAHKDVFHSDLDTEDRAFLHALSPHRYADCSGAL